VRFKKRSQSERREVSRHATNEAIILVASIFIVVAAKTTEEKIVHKNGDDDSNENATRSKNAEQPQPCFEKKKSINNHVAAAILFVV